MSALRRPGARITQSITLDGEQAGERPDRAGPEFNEGVPTAMARLAEAISLAAPGQP